MTSAVTHRPGPDGLFGSTALCGAGLTVGEVLRMHEYDYDCRECRRISGEHVEPEAAS